MKDAIETVLSLVLLTLFAIAGAVFVLLFMLIAGLISVLMMPVAMVAAWRQRGGPDE